VSLAAARLTLRQLCGLGVPAPLLLPALLPALRQLIHAAHAAFFFCDAQGHITKLYAEHLLSPQAMDGYYQRHYRSDAGEFSSRYLQRVAAARPVSAHSVTPVERASAYYAEVLQPLQIEHILYGIVRHQGRALGQLSLYRDAQGKPFSKADENTLADVLHYLGAALAQPTPPQPDTVLSRSAEEALAVLTRDGQPLYTDEHWPRLVRMASGASIAPAKAREEAYTLPRFVQSVLASVLCTPQALHRIESEWGSFVFRRHLMTATQGETEVIALLLTRLAAKPLQLVQATAQKGLSPQQREVALLLAQGASNKAIAERLGIGLNTVHYHVKQVFARLGVRERSEVERALRDVGR